MIDNKTVNACESWLDVAGFYDLCNLSLLIKTTTHERPVFESSSVELLPSNQILKYVRKDKI